MRSKFYLGWVVISVVLALARPTEAISILANSFGFAPFHIDTESVTTPSMLRVIQTDIFVSTSDQVVAKTFHDLEIVASTPSGAVTVALVGPVLNYPNPFHSYENTLLVFQANQSLTVDIKIYDQFGNRICTDTIDAEPSVTRWTFNRSLAGGHLSAGVYYVLLLSSGKLLGKCKMVVIP
jgi:hypothetical protein